MESEDIGEHEMARTILSSIENYLKPEPKEEYYREMWMLSRGESVRELASVISFLFFKNK
jgi:hypothetical protein